ncbi:unnamed protein product [Periconia digitata]|uniref:NAD(P)-binding protein n=1 Tax=Periconia digitata TaxID=1303443 RepID=A0A9W4XS62_9PLEO|nr:unnamed protein product [Periconia digitata]
MSRPFPSYTKTYHHTPSPTISPSRPALSASGKSILITGGGAGMGVQNALAFAEAGASHIALLGRRLEPLLSTKTLLNHHFPTVDVFTASVDIGIKQQVDTAFADFTSHTHGRKIDVLISNAAAIGPLESLGHTPVDEISSYIAASIKGAAYLADAFLRHRAPRDAVVVNVSSANAYLNLVPKYLSYGVAKAAIARLWDTVLFTNQGELCVYHTQPGIVDTGMNQEFRGGAPKDERVADEASLPANFNAWLASPEARFLNGRFVWANWDVDELLARKEEIEKSEDLKVSCVGWMRYGPTA